MDKRKFYVNLEQLERLAMNNDVPNLFCSFLYILLDYSQYHYFNDCNVSRNNEKLDYGKKKNKIVKNSISENKAIKNEENYKINQMDNNSEKDDALQSCESPLVKFIKKQNYLLKKKEKVSDDGNEEFSDTSLSSKWFKCWCVLKANILFYYSTKGTALPDGMFFLEDVKVEVCDPKMLLKQNLISSLPNNIKHLEKSSLIRINFLGSRFLKNSKRNLYIYALTPLTTDGWIKNIKLCSISCLQTFIKEEMQKKEKIIYHYEREKKISAVKLEKLEKEYLEISNKNKKLMLDIDRLEEANKKLQNSNEITEKVTAEYVDQKHIELMSFQKSFVFEITEKESLKREIANLRERLSKYNKLNQALLNEKNQLSERLRDMFRYHEEATDMPSKFVCSMQKLREMNTTLTLKNRKLKNENKELVKNFHMVENKMQSKIAILRSIVEAGDIFDYLRRWILINQYKVKYYETGYSLSEKEEKELLDKITKLQQDLRISEAVCHSSYITHRSRLLEEQLNNYTFNIKCTDYYELAKTTLDRFTWIFGEVETPIPVDKESGVELPWWSYTKVKEAKIPLLETIYPTGVYEGEQFNILRGSDILSPVDKLIPMSEHFKLKNKYDSLQLEHEELKYEYNKVMERTTEAIMKNRKMKFQEIIRQEV